MTPTHRHRRIRLAVVLAAGLAAVAAGASLLQPRRERRADPSTLVAAGWEAVDREDGAGARDAIRRLRRLGADPLATVVQARLLLARGFSRPALDVLAGVDVVGDGADGERLRRLVRLVRGEAAFRMRMMPVAERELAAVLASDPDSVDAHRLMAAMYYDAGVIPEAISHLEATARLAPADGRPHRLLGLIHNDYERYDEAVTHYLESLRRAPDQPDRDDVRTELAACQVKLRRHREALATLEPLPPGHVADVLRAECRLAIGERDAARRIVDEVLRSTPDDLGALLLDGEIRLEDGDPAGAAATLERAVAAHPHDYLARLKLAQACAGSGRDAEAEEQRAEAERIRSLRREFADLHQIAWGAPGDAAVRRRLAAMAGRLGRPDLERVWLEAAAAVESGTPPATGAPGGSSGQGGEPAETDPGPGKS